MLEIALQPGLPDGSFARLRPVCGHDEVLVDGEHRDTAVELLDRLLLAAPGTSVGPGRAAELALCDRDRLLAELYRTLYGDDVEARADCRHCGESFDLGFSLEALLSDLSAASGEVRGPDAEGVYRLSDGVRFRLPTSADLCALRGLDAETARLCMLDACRLDQTDDTWDPERLEAAIESVGPLLDLDLPASCPHCGGEQQIAFQIDRYLLLALGDERSLLDREVHLLACAYGWSLNEILGLPRRDRHTFVRLVQQSGGRTR